jgi:hypothetical protein
MAKLDFNPQAYQYDQGLKAIELMWTAARLALSSRQTEVHQEISEYRNYLDSGGEQIGEWDGPYNLWDHEGQLRLELTAVEDAMIELNRSVAITVYHHWERHVPNEGDKKFRDHKALVRELSRADIEVHPAIDALRFSANFLKHGNPDWLTKLQTGFREKFPLLKLPDNPDAISWGTLFISEQHVSWFLEIAKVSKRPIIGEM